MACSSNFRAFNMEEVIRALETLNPNKSIGHDKIPPRALKHVTWYTSALANKRFQCMHTDQHLARAIEKGYMGASSREG